MAGPEDQDPVEQAEREMRQGFDRMVRDYESRLLEIGEHHARAGVHADDPVDGARRLADRLLVLSARIDHALDTIDRYADAPTMGAVLRSVRTTLRGEEGR